MNKLTCTLVLLAVLVLPAWSQTAVESGTTVSDKPQDLSKGLDVVLAAEGGGSFFAGPSQPGAYAGAKVGLSNFVLSFGYDRLQGHSGFSGDLSYMIPVVRFPGPQKNEFNNFVRIYAEPGIGNRAGGAAFGPYLSGKVMAAFLSNTRLRFGSDSLPASPYVEFERRFPFQALGQGDNRISFGLMLTLCRSC